MAFEVPPLPYDYNALEPHIDEATMRFHQRQAPPGVRGQRQCSARGNALADKPVEHVLANLETLAEDKQTPVRNNAGGPRQPLDVLGDHGPGRRRRAVRRARGRRSATSGAASDELKKRSNENGGQALRLGLDVARHDGTGLAIYSTPNQDRRS